MYVRICQAGLKIPLKKFPLPDKNEEKSAA